MAPPTPQKMAKCHHRLPLQPPPPGTTAWPLPLMYVDQCAVKHPVCLQMGVAFVCILNRDPLLPKILIFVSWARPLVVVLSPGRSGKLRAF